MTSDPHSAWWVVPTPRPAASLRLFCLPYAGGSATAFHRFAQGFPESVEVVSLQPPGRGFRLGDPVVPDLASLLTLVRQAILPRLDKPYALFGHSLGALVAFELARALRQRGHVPPVHLFASAAPAPRAWGALRVSTTLPEAEFWSAVHELYGTPLTMAANPELLALVVPPLKADFALIAGYRYTPEAPLALPITGFFGNRDPRVDRTSVEAWSHETSASCAVHEVDGAHLFLQDAAPTVSALVCAALGAGYGIARASSADQ